MRMVSPSTGAEEVTLAVEQEQYQELTVARYRDTQGVVYVLSRWRLNSEDLTRVAAGEDIYIALMTFGAPPQPISVQVGPDGWQDGEEETTRRIHGDVNRELAQRFFEQAEAALYRESLMVNVLAEWAKLFGLTPETASPNDLDREIRLLVADRYDIEGPLEERLVQRERDVLAELHVLFQHGGRAFLNRITEEFAQW